MLNNYKKFNESHKNKKKKRNGSRKHGGFQQVFIPTFPKNAKPPNDPIKQDPNKRGMFMEYSDNFKYILTKMAKKGSKIAKDMLDLPDNPKEKFYFSYLDLAGNSYISYLNFEDKNIPDEDRYKSIKRKQSKIYKLIKTIFGAKYTKTEVTKFVSIYKQAYSEGPSKTAAVATSSDNKYSKSRNQILKSLIDDTKSNKMHWNRFLMDTMIRFESKLRVTEKKYVSFQLFHFIKAKHETSAFLTINFYDEAKKDKKSVWIDTFSYKDILELINLFREKFNLEVEE